MNQAKVQKANKRKIVAMMMRTMMIKKNIMMKMKSILIMGATLENTTQTINHMLILYRVQSNKEALRRLIKKELLLHYTRLRNNLTH